jgi:hypothetical protein
MNRTMIAGAAFAALGLAACSGASTPATDGASASSGAAAKRMPLPDCASDAAKTVDAGADGWKHPDCRLMLTDKSGLALEARYNAAEDDSTKVKIQVVMAGDATLQTIEETMGNTFAGISLQDIDQDGRMDILAPLETGNVNTSWGVWRQADDGKSFTRMGEPEGVSIENTKSGYVAVPARSSANQWGIAFYKIEAGVLKPILTADVTARGEADKITGVDCVVTDDGGLASTGMDAKAAKKAFCAEPVVANTFK